jgi:hypothetical protein
MVSMISDPHPTPTFTVTLLDGSRVAAGSPAHLAVIGTPEWQAHLVALRDARRAKGPPMCLRGTAAKPKLAF